VGEKPLKVACFPFFFFKGFVECFGRLVRGSQDKSKEEKKKLLPIIMVGSIN
jgi:hypothetical protein